LAAFDDLIIRHVDNHVKRFTIPPHLAPANKVTLS